MNHDLTVGKPEGVLWRFCLPLFGSVLFQQLYNIADSLVAGKLIGENALAAVGNSYVCENSASRREASGQPQGAECRRYPPGRAETGVGAGRRARGRRD